MKTKVLLQPDNATYLSIQSYAIVHLLTEIQNETRQETKSKQKDRFLTLFNQIIQIRKQFQKFQEFRIIPIDFLNNISLLQMILGKFLFNTIYQIE